jgi:Ca-activated chloride channel family protein
MTRIILAALLLGAVSAAADGIIIPEPRFQPLAVKYHRVQVTIDDQAAHTDIDQIFVNSMDWEVEGTYMFPLPQDASFSAFSMFVDGEPLTAEILPADEARQIYEEIVRQRIDPALLEYVGRGAYRARIFPIPAQGQRRIELAYDEILRRDGGIVRYLYPLNTEKFSSEPLEDVSVQVTLRSSAPIKAIYSPTHEIVVERQSETEARVIYADEGVLPTEDFALYYTLSPDPVGIEVLTHFPEDEDAGYYMLLAAPQAEPVTDAVIPKRMIYVLDRSGSMVGDKIEQAREALRFAVQSMRPEDAFNIIDYGTTIETFADGAVQVSEQTRSEALAYVDEIVATGGTNIQGALLEAAGMLQDDEYAEMVVFLTDGRPTIGVTDLEQILADVAAANVATARIFVFGVGHEVNTHLLDLLAQQNGGTSTYVKPGEDIELAVSSFYTKVSSPVLTELELEFVGGRAHDVYPTSLPDLFRGSQIVQLGRLEPGGEALVRLSGMIVGSPQAFERPVSLEDGGRVEFLPRLWATRKVGFLLDQIRLNGEDAELVDEIVSLSKRYGIITPYTSFLIVEDEPRSPISEAPGLSEDSGADAVRAAEDVADYAGASTTNQVRSEQVRYAGDKTFYLRDGYWQDSRYDDSLPTITLDFGSEAYFQLLREQPGLGRYLAVDARVVVRSGHRQYRVEDMKTSVENGATVPGSSHLEPNFPNPFNPSTTIRFHLERTGPASLTVYDATGRRVRTLVDGEVLAAASHSVEWDGRDSAGEPVASGVYLYSLESGAEQLTRKMVLMK